MERFCGVVVVGGGVPNDKNAFKIMVIQDGDWGVITESTYKAEARTVFMLCHAISVIRT